MKNKDQLVRKVLVLNPGNVQDNKIIEYLTNKKFSTYVRKLIEEDMTRNGHKDNSGLNEVYKMILDINRRIDGLYQDRSSNGSNSSDTTNATRMPEYQAQEESNIEEDSSLEESGELSEEEKEQLNLFENIGIGV